MISCYDLPVQKKFILISQLSVISANILLVAGLLFLSRNLLRVDTILFEEIIVCVFISLLIFLISRKLLLKLIPEFKNDFVYSVIIGSLISLLLFPNSLLNVDRSRSFYVLSWVDKGEVKLTESELSVNVESPEAADQAAIQQRIAEQIKRGLIMERSGNLSLTQKGKILVFIANNLAEIFNLDGWASNNH
jgi:hypothetical protein